MTEIKPWQDRVKPGAFTGVKMEAMLAEIAELRAALAKSQPVEQKKCGNTSCAKTDANGGVHDCWYPDCLTEAKPTPTTTAAVLPNGVTASNVYEAYAEGLKAGAQPVEQGEPVRPMSDERIEDLHEVAMRSLRRHKNSIRGQMVTPQDTLQWHFARAIEAHIKGATE